MEVLSKPEAEGVGLPRSCYTAAPQLPHSRCSVGASDQHGAPQPEAKRGVKTEVSPLMSPKAALLAPSLHWAPVSSERGGLCAWGRGLAPRATV